ncbi:MAG: UDP-N-acetylmuramoyl-L-alanine--D-glutamate ligase [Eubacteriales bacterium]
MDLNQKKVLVFGSGISGIGASKLLVEIGAEVILYDGATTRTEEEIIEQLAMDIVEVVIGDLSEEKMKQLDLVVLSPGVPTDLPVVEKMRALEIPIWGEVELAYQFGKGDVLAITGTNGKTTTTALLGMIMKVYREETYIVGNIGNPYTEVALDMTERSIVVAEMSSFQLETIDTFAPQVSAILNITPDHLNRHHTMEAYIEAKKSIAINQTKNQICVLNYEDEVTREFGKNVNAQVLYFSSQRKLDKGVYLVGDEIVCDIHEKEVLCNIHELRILGKHNFENVMAAAAMAISYGVPHNLVRKVVLEFVGVEHRIEFVCEKHGVRYYNDSKGTNPDAAIKGIQAMNRPTILIGGGYNKDSTYEEWIQSFDGKVKMLILTGQTRFMIQEAAMKCGFTNIMLIESFEEAVEKSAQIAKQGDAVLLSPACASWGVFRNYEERGDKFKELVKNL